MGYGEPPKELTERLAALNAGTLSERQTLELFGELIRTNWAWRMIGWYGQAAVALIEAGYLTRLGEITPWGEAAILRDEARRAKIAKEAENGI